MIIYKKTIPLLVRNEIPYGWEYVSSQSGFMNSALFLLWLQSVIYPYVKKMKTKILLILDNASCHLSFDALVYARNHDIEIISLPPNTTNFLQPLDQLFFVLKNSFYNIASRLQLIRPGNTIRPCNFPHLLKQSMSDSWNSTYVKNSFRKTGVIPINRNAIDFTPTEIMPSISDYNAYTNEIPCNECGRINVCETCIISNNTLVKHGLISDEVASKVLYAPKVIAHPRKNKGTARRLTQDLTETNHTNQTDQTNQTNLTNQTEAPDQTAKGKKRTVKKQLTNEKERQTTSTKQTDSSIKCPLCNKLEGQGDFEPMWVGCDGINCNYWVHLHCLSISEQLKVILSFSGEGREWYCPICSLNYPNQPSFEIICDVCVLPVDVTGILPDAAKCGVMDCMHIMHLSCLPEAKHLEYHKFRFHGRPMFLCNTCENQ